METENVSHKHYVGVDALTIVYVISIVNAMTFAIMMKIVSVANVNAHVVI